MSANMDDRRGHNRWTARFAMRVAGAFFLAAVVVMALLGVSVVDVNRSARVFFIYWTIFFFFLLCAIAIAMLDAIVTIGKFRTEHAKLRTVFRRELDKQHDAGQQESEQRHE